MQEFRTTRPTTVPTVLADLFTADDPAGAQFITDVAGEFQFAEREHDPLNSFHEAYAVILEELEEFWDEVKKKRRERDCDLLRAELVQVAAMCLRTAINLHLRRGE